MKSTLKILKPQTIKGSGNEKYNFKGSTMDIYCKPTDCPFSSAIGMYE